MNGTGASAGRHHTGGSRSLGFVVLSVSDTHTEEDDVSGHLAERLLTEAGHSVVHYDLVANECAHGIQRVACDTGVPVAFGVLATDTAAQALARSDKGREAAATAVEMARLLRAVS